jgi:hypothetical protein
MKAMRYICLAAILALSACNVSDPSETNYSSDFSRGVEQPYMVSDGYFIGNWYEGDTNPSCLIFRDFACFDTYFTIGWYMGLDESKLITEERMKGGFVISVIYKGYDVTKLGIERVILHNGRLIVYYTREVIIENATFTGGYHLTMLVDDCVFDSVILFENGSRLEHVPVTEMNCD